MEVHLSVEGRLEEASEVRHFCLIRGLGYCEGEDLAVGQQEDVVLGQVEAEAFHRKASVAQALYEGMV